MKNFLNVRAKGMPHSEVPAGMLYNCISSSLMDMAKEGITEESEADSFNLPYYAASLEEMEEIVEKDGAAMEGMFARHFGSEVIDEMFGRVTDKLLDISDLVNSRRDEKSQLVAVLKRK
ncbi:hypothetical protein EV1_011191 [Malus domestica]